MTVPDTDDTAVSETDTGCPSVLKVLLLRQSDTENKNSHVPDEFQEAVRIIEQRKGTGVLWEQASWLGQSGQAS